MLKSIIRIQINPFIENHVKDEVVAFMIRHNIYVITEITNGRIDHFVKQRIIDDSGKRIKLLTLQSYTATPTEFVYKDYMNWKIKSTPMDPDLYSEYYDFETDGLGIKNLG